MGLAPYGQDCCPCVAHEQDYRVYPWTKIGSHALPFM